jgi:hypothetical protein
VSALAFSTASAGAATVPVDALGPIGDERVTYPHYSSTTHSAPSATVGTAGDVNGDGPEDTIMALESWDPGYPETTWVNFTHPDLPSSTSAGTAAWQGFAIVGRRWYGSTGLGDLNGDGLGEVAVSEHNSIAVVFGRDDGDPVDLSALGSDGFRIEGVEPRGASGFGTVQNGTAYMNDTVASAGDQNGDGRDDLIFRDGDDVKVAYLPAAAPASPIDADVLGAGGYVLDTATDDVWYPFFDMLGDLDGDSRNDPVVIWTDESTGVAHAVGVLAPDPGATVDLSTAAEDSAGFELSLPGMSLERGISVGDQNGDGKRDVGFVGVEGHRTMVIAFTPDVGAEGEVDAEARDEAIRVRSVYTGHVLDVGDQDGDGRSDLGFSGYVHFSSTDFQGLPGAAMHENIAGGLVDPAVLGGVSFISGGSNQIIVGSTADRNADGRRELLLVHADPYSADQPYEATWKLDTFMSAPRPTPVDVEPPRIDGEELEFEAEFATAPVEQGRSLGARAFVKVEGGCTEPRYFAAERIRDANRATTRVSISIDAAEAGLAPGEPFRYSVLLENGRGLVGATAPRDGRADGLNGGVGGCGTPPPPFPEGGDQPPATPSGRVARGTRRGDKLRGTPWEDQLFGMRGDDRITGLAGADLIKGGADQDSIKAGDGVDLVIGGGGNDRIWARDGEADRVKCGGGRDKALVDRQDRAKGCEKLRKR